MLLLEGREALWKHSRPPRRDEREREGGGGIRSENTRCVSASCYFTPRHVIDWTKCDLFREFVCPKSDSCVLCAFLNFKLSRSFFLNLSLPLLLCKSIHVKPYLSYYF